MRLIGDLGDLSPLILCLFALPLNRGTKPSLALCWHYSMYIPSLGYAVNDRP